MSMSLRPSWSTQIQLYIVRPCLNQNKNDISQDRLKSNFKVGKYTTREHIGKYCLSVASYNKGFQVYFNSNNIVD